MKRYGLSELVSSFLDFINNDKKVLETRQLRDSAISYFATVIYATGYDAGCSAAKAKVVPEKILN
jgi:hypothetical protein